MAPQSCALAALLLAACLLAAQGAAADTGCGCPLCGASFDVPAKQTLAAAAAHTISAPQAGSSPTQHDHSGGGGSPVAMQHLTSAARADLSRCSAAGGRAESAAGAASPPAGPPPAVDASAAADTAADAATDTAADAADANSDLAALLEKPPTPEFCEALTAAVNVQVTLRACCWLLLAEMLSASTIVMSSRRICWHALQQGQLMVCSGKAPSAPHVSAPARRQDRCRAAQQSAQWITRRHHDVAGLWTCVWNHIACLAMQDRAAHFERVFGADGAGLRCEALVNSAKAAMARAVSLAATPGPEHEHLRRGRGRWHRSRLYHAMRQARGFSTGV